MSPLSGGPSSVTTGWFAAGECRVEDLREIVEQTTVLADYPHADDVVENVLMCGPRLTDQVGSEPDRRAVQAELARALLQGPASWFSRARSRVRWSTRRPPRSTI